MDKTGLELWAASKIIGRECATQSKQFFLCKKEKGENPAECLALGTIAHNCATDIVNTISTDYPKEYQSFQKCLDTADYRFNECRKEERALLDCWNARNNSLHHN